MYALIGERLSHSYSKIIHQMLGNDEYALLELTPKEVEPFLRARAFRGINVTIPYKKTVMPFCDRLTDAARRIGSVNTIINENGCLIGHNTDYEGFAHMTRNIPIKGKKVLIFGAGGTSLTAQAVVADRGAARVTVKGREDAASVDSEVLINTTPVGMYPQNDACLISLNDFPHCQAVVDVIYNPLRTRLRLQCGDKIPSVGGLTMLAAQAYYAAKCFGTAGMEADALIAACEKRFRNIVLIGMPGAGKTTIGKLLAERLQMPFADTDALIEAAEGRTIPAIFATDGEAYFRRAEQRIIADIGKRTGAVIAVGGGAILNDENYLNLRQNGTIVLVERAREKLATAGRPLSVDLDKLYKERQPQYRMKSTISVDNNGAMEKTVADIQDALQNERNNL